MNATRTLRVGRKHVEITEKHIRKMGSLINKDSGVFPVKEEMGQCWVWTGNLNNGYAAYGGRVHGRLRISRVTWLLETGDDPGDLLVCHHCDNPACVNPQHLFLGSHLDNTIDAKQKNRLKLPSEVFRVSGEASHFAKLTKKQVFEIRELFKADPNERGLSGRVGKDYGVSRETVRLIAKGEIWRNTN